MPFGKHKGEDIRTLPDGYLNWLYRSADLYGDLAAAVEFEWRLRNEEPYEEPDEPDEPAAGDFALADPADRALLAELVSAGFRALAMKYHPDRGGDPERMVRLNRLMERLRGALAT